MSSSTPRINNNWNTISISKVHVFGEICRIPDRNRSFELPVFDINEVNCTNSKYQGPVNELGYCGYGRYEFPHGAVYEGNFKLGEFHGEGVLTYPKGQSIKGIWEKGKLVESVFVPREGFEYRSDEPYLQMPDRTYRDEVTPDGSILIKEPREITSSITEFHIPKGAYDTGDGYFVGETKMLFDMQHRPRSIVTAKDEKIIKTHFKRKTERAVTFDPTIYEFWTSGRHSEDKNIVETIKSQQRKESYVKNSLNKRNDFELHGVAKEA